MLSKNKAWKRLPFAAFGFGSFALSPFAFPLGGCVDPSRHVFF